MGYVELLFRGSLHSIGCEGPRFDPHLCLTNVGYGELWFGGSQHSFDCKGRWFDPHLWVPKSHARFKLTNRLKEKARRD